MITDFDNYLTFLHALYEEKNRKNKYFSYEYMTQKLGLKSRSHIYRIFKGERKLNPHMGIRLSQIIGMSHLETDYFITLILLNNSESPDEKSFLIEKINHLKTLLIKRKSAA